MIRIMLRRNALIVALSLLSILLISACGGESAPASTPVSGAGTSGSASSASNTASMSTPGAVQTSVPHQASADQDIVAVVQDWMTMHMSMPYKDLSVRTLKQDDAFATVEVHAQLRKDAASEWDENIATFELKNVSGQWRIDRTNDFVSPRIQATTTAQTVATAQAVAIAGAKEYIADAPTGDFTDIAMVSPSEGWIVGKAPDSKRDFSDNGFVTLHITNGKVEPVVNPLMLYNVGRLPTITMLSQNEGWAFSNSTHSSQLYLHYENGTWQYVQSEGGGLPARVSMLSSTSGWGVRWFEGYTSLFGQIYNYSNGQWTALPDKFDVLNDIQMLSPTDGWAVGNSDYHYDGKSWTRVDWAIPYISGINMISPNEGWVVSGHGAVGHYLDGKLRQVDSPVGDIQLNRVQMISQQDGWAVGQQGTIIHYTGTKWELVPSPTKSDLNGLHMLSATDGWIVGSGGTILHYKDGKWGMYKLAAANVNTPESMATTVSQKTVQSMPPTEIIRPPTSQQATVTSTDKETHPFIDGSEIGGFHEPRGIATDAQGNLYVTDSNTSRVAKFDPSGKPVFLIEGRKNEDPALRLLEPTGIAVDVKGNIYVSDTAGHKIQKLDQAGKFVAQWGGQINLSDPADANSPDKESRFFGPRGIAVGPEGFVYVADTGNERITIFDASGKYARQISSAVTSTAPGGIQYPIGVVVDAGGNVYVADTNNQRIQKFDKAGKLIVAWSIPEGYWSPSPDHLEPYLALDKAGNLYSTGPSNASVLKFSTTGEFLGSKSSEGALHLKKPTGIAIGSDGALYVVDTAANAVVKMSAITTANTGTPSTASPISSPSSVPSPMLAPSPTVPALPTQSPNLPKSVFASGGLGLSRAAWQKLHGKGGEGLFGAQPGKDGYNTEYLSTKSGELVGIIAKSYDPGVSIDKARAESRKLLPADVQPLKLNENVGGETYDTYLSQSLRDLVPAGTPKLTPESEGPYIWNGLQPGAITIKYDGDGTNTIYMLIYIGSSNK